MGSAAENMRLAMTRALNHMVYRKLSHARSQIRKSALERLHLENNSFDDGFDAPLGPTAYHELTKVDADGDGVVTATDIFSALKEARDCERGEEKAAAELMSRLVDEGGDDTINSSDFKRLFRALDLEFTDGQVDRLFAMTDLNGSQTVSEDEFDDAWKLLMEEILNHSVQTAGLSPTRIYLLTAAAIVLLLLLFAFILLAMSCWVSEDSFGAVVQSLLVGFVGKAVTGLRERTKAEQGKAELDTLVRSLVHQQADDANDD